MPLEIAQLGQPALRVQAAPVPVETIGTPEFQKFLDDMQATLTEARGVGLAAPQVFANRRVFLAAVLPSADPDDDPEVEFFINPRIVEPSAEMKNGWEGCLSFLELLVYVPRHVSLRVEYLDRAGKPKALRLEGFPARVIQHEYDHLDGVLTIDRAATTRHIIKASEIDDARDAIE